MVLVAVCCHHQAHLDQWPSTFVCSPGFKWWPIDFPSGFCFLLTSSCVFSQAHNAKAKVNPLESTWCSEKSSEVSSEILVNFRNIINAESRWNPLKHASIVTQPEGPNGAHLTLKPNNSNPPTNQTPWMVKSSQVKVPNLKTSSNVPKSYHPKVSAPWQLWYLGRVDCWDIPSKGLVHLSPPKKNWGVEKTRKLELEKMKWKTQVCGISFGKVHPPPFIRLVFGGVLFGPCHFI